MNKWQKEARQIIKEFAACQRQSEKIQHVENLADKSTDLAIWEEILEYAVLGAVNEGTKPKKKNVI